MLTTAGLLQQIPADLTGQSIPCVALQQYNQNRSLAEAEVLADRAWAWDRVRKTLPISIPSCPARSHPGANHLGGSLKY